MKRFGRFFLHAAAIMTNHTHSHGTALDYHNNLKGKRDCRNNTKELITEWQLVYHDIASILHCNHILHTSQDLTCCTELLHIAHNTNITTQAANHQCELHKTVKDPTRTHSTKLISLLNHVQYYVTTVIFDANY